MAKSKRSTTSPPPPAQHNAESDEVSVREELDIDHPTYKIYRYIEVRTRWTGTKAALIACGIATLEQFPTGENGSPYWCKSGGTKGWKKNPAQRWQVTRHHRQSEVNIFDVRRWHEPRSVAPAFERFMREAMRPLAS